MALHFELRGFKELVSRFAEAGSKGKNTLSRATNQAGAMVESEAKKIVYQGHPEHLIKGKGTLRNSITHEMIGQLAVRIGPGVVYGAIQEFGGTIVPINGPYLVFHPSEVITATRTMKDGRKVNYQKSSPSDQLVFAKKVVIPPRPYMRPALAKCRDRIRANFQKAVASLLGGKS